MIVDPIDYERMNASVILFFKCLKKDDAEVRYDGNVDALTIDTKLKFIQINPKPKFKQVGRAIQSAQALSEIEVTEESLHLCDLELFCARKTTSVFDLTITSWCDDEESPAPWPRQSRRMDKTRTPATNVQSRSTRSDLCTKSNITITQHARLLNNDATNF